MVYRDNKFQYRPVILNWWYEYMNIIGTHHITQHLANPYFKTKPSYVDTDLFQQFTFNLHILFF